MGSSRRTTARLALTYGSGYRQRADGLDRRSWLLCFSGCHQDHVLHLVDVPLHTSLNDPDQDERCHKDSNDRATDEQRFGAPFGQAQVQPQEQ
eukprot:scaffold434_cov186-Pinguiococcus_pyrenoidosus.AAC.11